MNKPDRSQGRPGGNHNPVNFDKTQITLAADKLPASLFSGIAEGAAKYAAEWDAQKKEASRSASKPTQLRKFYDEICMWHGKVQGDADRMEKFLPFILMLKAKIAYSKGRKHVNGAYEETLNHCLAELEKNPSPQTLNNLKFFMEAFTGFYKVYGPK